MELNTSKPNSGRIYDYLLGGAHNFPADRAAGDRLVQLDPSIPKWMRLNRWFLYYAVDQLAAGQFACYIDLATGLPTQGYLHDRVAAGTRIIYNDIDPATVMFARRIIGNQPNICYVESDIRNIDTILNAAEEHFGPERRIGICMVGITYFLEDAALTNITRRLFDWADSGSWLALSFVDFRSSSDSSAEMLHMYKQMGTPIYPRSEEYLLRLIQPWQEQGAGIQPLTAFAEQQLGRPIQIEGAHEYANMFGAILVKP